MEPKPYLRLKDLQRRVSDGVEVEMHREKGLGVPLGQSTYEGSLQSYNEN